MARDAGGNPLNRVHRRQFLFSGLLICGRCGGTYAVQAADRYGCATRRGKGTCDNRTTITRQRIEARVLGALKASMLTPASVERFIAHYAEEVASAQKDSEARKSGLEQQLVATGRRIEGVLSAIEKGAWNEVIQARLTELERVQASMKAELAALVPAQPVLLHPNAAALYAEQDGQLEAALNDPALRSEAATELRALVERVILTPSADAPDGLAAELEGALATILNLASSASFSGSRRLGVPNEKPPRTDVLGGLLSVVAGRGFEPLTFRL